MTTHSKLDSPSAADLTEACSGSVALTRHLPDEQSASADEGTLAHWLASETLTAIFINGEARIALDHLAKYPDGSHHCPDVSPSLRITRDMCEYVQVYIDYCVRASDGAEDVFIEHRVNFSRSIEIDGDSAAGTADFIALFVDSATVVDLKFGQSPKGIKYADGSQLKRYALGVREAFSMLTDFQRWKLVIVQPRLDHIDELEMTDVELTSYQEVARLAAARVREAIAAQDAPEVSEEEWSDIYLEPGDHCVKNYCKARAWCPALAAQVAATVSANTADGMEDLTATTVPSTAEALGVSMAKVDMIEGWCKAVRAETEKRLIAGEAVDGYKLVEGRRGARAWTDETEAEKLMREKFRLKVEEAYNLKLISPTQAEKVVTSPRRWKQLEALIDRSPGKPSVAPASDKRPAISVQPTAEGMEEIDIESARVDQIGAQIADSLAGLLD